MHSSDYDYLDPVPDQDNPHPGVMELFTIHHNGDFSGDVVFNLERWRVASDKLISSLRRNDQPVTEVSIPFQVIAQLVAEAVLAKKIDTLERAEYKEILGL